MAGLGWDDDGVLNAGVIYSERSQVLTFCQESLETLLALFFERRRSAEGGAGEQQSAEDG